MEHIMNHILARLRTGDSEKIEGPNASTKYK
jgi:hypothetical protein